MDNLESACVRVSGCRQPRALPTVVGKAICLIALATQAGCASSPESIQARYVSPNMYQTWDCRQLFEEKARLTSEVERISGLQRENANADTAMMTVGLIIFWPALIGLAATKDRKDELGRLKGEYDAVDLSIRTRQCSLPAPGPSAPSPSAPNPEPLAAAATFNGIYKGTGKTESWCLPPVLTLNVKGDTVDGQLSELSSVATSSAVAGTVNGAGVISLQFKGISNDYYSGRVDGSVKGNVINLDIRTTTAKACTYHFERARTPLVAVAPK